MRVTSARVTNSTIFHVLSSGSCGINLLPGVVEIVLNKALNFTRGAIIELLCLYGAESRVTIFVLLLTADI